MIQKSNQLTLYIFMSIEITMMILAAVASTSNLGGAEWLTSVAGGIGGEIVAVVLILSLIALELYRSSGRSSAKMVKHFYHVIVPLMCVFAVSVVFSIYAVIM